MKYCFSGEELPKPEEDPPPLVLLVERVVSESGEPWWIKEALEKLGLLTGSYRGKRVAVPNMTHYTSLVYKGKFDLMVFFTKISHNIINTFFRQ